MMTPPVGSTYPQAGVITTRPPTAPEQKPRTLGLPRSAYSSIAQVNEATAVARVVVMNAFAAIPSGARALPALKPYQPTQSNPVPTMQSREFHTFRDRANDQCRRDNREHELIHREDILRNPIGIIAVRMRIHAAEKSELQSAEKRGTM